VPERRATTGRLIRTAVVIVVVLIALTTAGYLLLPRLSHTDVVRRLTEMGARLVTGYDVRIARLNIEYDRGFRARGLTVAEPGADPFLVVDHLDLTVPLVKALAGRVGKIDLEGFALFLDRLPHGTRGEAPTRLPFDRLRASDGAIHFRAANGRDIALPALRIAFIPIGSGERLVIRGGIELPDDAGALHWDGTTTSDGSELVTVVDGNVPDLDAALAALGQPGLEHVEAFDALARPIVLRVAAEVDGDLGGKLALELDGGVATADLRDPIAFGGRAELDTGERAAQLAVTVTITQELPLLRAAGTLHGLWGQGELGGDLRLTWQDVPLARLAAWTAPRLPITSTRGNANVSADVALAGGSVTATGGVELADAGVGFDAGNVRLTAAIPFTYAGRALTVGDAGLRVQDFSASYGGLDASFDEASARGTITARDGGVDASFDGLHLTGLSLHDEAQLHVADDLTVSGSGSVTTRGTNGTDVTLVATSEKGELLWNRIYLNLAEHHLDLDGRLHVSEGRVQASELELTDSAIGHIAAHGSIRRGGGLERIDADFDLPGLADAFDVFVRAPLGESFPTLAATSISGRLHGSLRREPAATGFGMLSGRVVLDGGRAAIDSQRVVVDGLSMDVPIDVAAGAKESTSQKGFVAITGAKIGDVTMPGLRAPLAVKRNRIEVTRPLEAAVLGGTVALRDVSVGALGRPSWKAELAADLDALDLAEVTRAAGMPAVAGTLTGSFPHIAVTGDGIDTQGAVHVHTAAGGEITATDLHVDQPLSRVRTVGMNLEIERIDLAKATSTFGVGHVSGILHGAVNELEVVGGQPMRFDAWMETVPEKGVPQQISVTAIRQLSILGGAGGDPFTQGILSFFDEYRYAKMGLRCRLRNDRFVLHGVEQLDGKDFLVVGSFFPPTVNVISHNQVISFSEMVRRLSRITAVSGSDRHTEVTP
jgi:hypothetical protein